MVFECIYKYSLLLFTNAIENWFSVMKSKLQKKDGLTCNNLKRNIQNVIEEIPETIFINIFKGSYERNNEKIKKQTRKLNRKNYKVGVLNFQICNNYFVNQRS